jgi:mannosylglycerate hydrolase
MNKQKSIGYVVPHVHWDREWRYALWEKRAMLVEFMDELLDLLEKDPDYKCFLLDGQSIIIEDYLQIRPENRQRLKKHISDGRISIGPWYTLPDLYPLDGECLVRNLLKGIRLSNEYGGHLKVAYNSFGWGQTAQMPQLYSQFGLDFIICAKKVSNERAPECEFIWEAPDGTGVLTSRLGEYARANFFFNCYIPITHGADYFSDEFNLKWGQDGLTVRNASAEKCHDDFFRLDSCRGYFPEKIKDSIQKAWDSLKDTTVPSCRLLMSGCDCNGCQPDLSRIIADANKLFDDIEFVHGTLEQYAEQLKKLIDHKKLRVIRGELRDGPAEACTANALAVRIYIKMRNKQAENMLIRRAEPLASVLSMMGVELPALMFDIAWDYMLKSHPHDSINGATGDITVDDTMNRLQQALEIARSAAENSARTLIKQIDLSGYSEKDVLLVLLNTAPNTVSDVLKVSIDIPREENTWSFVLKDPQGNICPVQHISQQEKTSPVKNKAMRHQPFYHDRHMLYIDPGQLPAGGYKVFKVEPVERFDRKKLWWQSTRKSTGREISQAPNRLENEHLSVTINANGTVNLTDKATGKEYHNLLYYEDAGDVGDYWVYSPPHKNQIHNSLGGKARIWCQDNGPLIATVAIEVKMQLPAYGTGTDSVTKAHSCRSKETKELVITSYISLKRGSRKLDIRTSVNNNIENHRLRIMFPTGLQATDSYSLSHFNVDKRPIEPAKNADGTFYPEMQTYPMQQFADVTDNKNGLAVISNCLAEYEVLRDEQKTLAITLFRSVNNRLCAEYRSAREFPMEKGGQCLRLMEFEYALYPHAGNWVKAKVYKQAQSLNTGVTVYQTTSHKQGHLGQCQSLFSIEPENLILSAFKRAEDSDSYILRVFNPTDETLKGKITMPVELKQVYMANLNEERKEAIKLSSPKTFDVTVEKGKIITLEMVV